jgi:hypothetical protein
MPPKRKTAAPASVRPSRATKTKASDTIHQAIRRPGRQSAPVLTQPASGAVLNPTELGAMLETLPQFAGIEERFQVLETSITDNQTALRSVLNDTFDQIMERFDGMEAPASQWPRCGPPGHLGSDACTRYKSPW